VHVLQVTPYFPPTWAFGGIPRIVDGLSRALVGQGVQVSVLTTDAYDGERRADVPSLRDHHGVRVMTVPNVHNGLAYDHQLFLPRGVGAALDRLEAEVGAPDVIHLHGHRHLLNNGAVRWARRRGIPHVLTANGTLTRHEQKIGVKLLWDLAVAGHIPKGAARCVAVSAADAARHAQAGVPLEKIVRIPNGLDLGEFEALPPAGTFRRAHKLGDRPIVAYLGRISPRKGVEHLVQAFAGGGPCGSVLVVAGNDMGALATARAAAGPDVRFVGVVGGEERLALLADADVLVYASAAEVFGLVPFEGLLCGSPVVVGDDCGCGELISEAGAGLLVRHGDVAGIRARVRTLLEDGVAAAAMVTRGRAYIEAHLGFEVVAKQHAALYAEVA
jgi:glycosyltransferase involved in cell wall biosynthesis